MKPKRQRIDLLAFPSHPGPVRGTRGWRGGTGTRTYRKHLARPMLYTTILCILLYSGEEEAAARRRSHEQQQQQQQPLSFIITSHRKVKQLGSSSTVLGHLFSSITTRQDDWPWLHWPSLPNKVPPHPDSHPPLPPSPSLPSHTAWTGPGLPGRVCPPFYLRLSCVMRVQCVIET